MTDRQKVLWMMTSYDYAALPYLRATNQLNIENGGINMMFPDNGLTKMWKGVPKDAIKERIAEKYETIPDNVLVWTDDVTHKLKARVEYYLSDNEIKEIEADLKNRQIVLDMKDEISKLVQKHQYDFNHQDTEDDFLKAQEELLQKMLEKATAALEKELQELRSKYLYKTTDSIHQWGPSLKAEIAELYGLPQEWVEIYLENEDDNKITILIRPAYRQIVFSHPDEQEDISDNAKKELHTEHRLQARMDEFDAGGITDQKLITASFIEVMTEEYDVPACDVIIEKRSKDCFAISTRYWPEGRLPLFVHIGRIFEENEEEPTKSSKVLDSMKKSFIRACTAPYGDTSYTLRHVYGDEINSQALKEHIARDTGFEPENIKLCLDSNGAMYISVEY